MAEMSPDTARSERPTEYILWQGSYSPKAMIGSWLLVAFLTIAIAVGLILIPGDQTPKLMVGGGIIGVMWLWTIGSYLYRRFSVNYEFTSERLVHRAGILIRTTDRIEVIDIDDVSFTQGIVQRMLNVGKISLKTSDSSHPHFELIGIDDVEAVSEIIDATRREERRKRAFHIESV